MCILSIAHCIFDAFRYSPEVSTWPLGDGAGRSLLGAMGQHIVLAAWCVAVGLLVCTARRDRQVVATSCLLQAIPMFSPLGWGHAYVFAYPITLIVFHGYATRDREAWF